jgi:membrane protease YdiL (CAAX protease family)
MAPVQPASRVGRLLRWVSAAPAYEAEAADLRTTTFLGLPLPRRATVAVLIVALIMLLDYYGRINPLVDAVLGHGTGSGADMRRLSSIGRLILLGAVPLLIVVAGFHDRPSRYGIRLGDWRAGLAIALVGCLVMTPVVLLIARDAAFSAYYAPMASTPFDAFLSAALEVIPAEFFFRGFLLFALLRVAGPLAVVLATLPFAFAHLGKPEIETISTLGGGFLFGWLDWRTGSVLWSGLAHAWILGLVVVAAGFWAGTLTG